MDFLTYMLLIFDETCYCITIVVLAFIYDT